MQKNSGHFNLFGLLSFIALRPRLPQILKKTQTGYSKEVKKLLKDNEVPDDSGGWYLWGRFNDAAWWQPIYIGKAMSGKTSNLRVRLYDEFREEYAALYAAVYGRDAVTSAIRKQLNIARKKNLTKKDYFKQGESIQRSLRKTDTQFIIWVRASKGMSDKKIRSVEYALINLYRPAFNSRRLNRGKQNIFHNPLVTKVDEAIETEIKEMRGEFKI